MASKIYTSDSIKLMQFSNRLGAVPVLGSIIGAMRLTVSLVIAVATSFFLLIKWIAGSKNSEDVKRLYSFSWAHVLLGFAEIIPIVGTIAHIIFKNIVEEIKVSPSICWLSFSFETSKNKV